MGADGWPIHAPDGGASPAACRLRSFAFGAGLWTGDDGQGQERLGGAPTHGGEAEVAGVLACLQGRNGWHVHVTAFLRCRFSKMLSCCARTARGSGQRCLMGTTCRRGPLSTLPSMPTTSRFFPGLQPPARSPALDSNVRVLCPCSLRFSVATQGELAFLCSNESEVTLNRAQMYKPMGLVFEESGGQDKSIVRTPPPCLPTLSASCTRIASGFDPSTPHHS